MAKSAAGPYVENNKQYADDRTLHKPAHPGKQPIRPGRRLAVLACMDARLDVEDLLGLQTGEAHIIRMDGVSYPGATGSIG